VFFILLFFFVFMSLDWTYRKKGQGAATLDHFSTMLW